MAQDVVGQFVPQDHRQLIVAGRKSGHSRADKQAATVCAGVELIRRVELNVIATGKSGLQLDLADVAVPAHRQHHRPARQGEVEPPQIGSQAVESGRAAHGTGFQGVASNGEDQIPPANTRRRGGGVGGHRDNPRQVALKAEPRFSHRPQFLAVLTGRVQGPAGGKTHRRAEIGVGVRQALGDARNPFVKVRQAGQTLPSIGRGRELGRHGFKLVVAARAQGQQGQNTPAQAGTGNSSSHRNTAWSTGMVSVAATIRQVCRQVILDTNHTRPFLVH